MKPKEFPEANVIFAKGQKEYNELPAFRDETGNTVTLWQLSPEEMAKVAETGEIWLSVMTFNKPLQPVFLSTEKPLVPIAPVTAHEIPGIKDGKPEKDFCICQYPDFKEVKEPGHDGRRFTQCQTCGGEKK